MAVLNLGTSIYRRGGPERKRKKERIKRKRKCLVMCTCCTDMIPRVMKMLTVELPLRCSRNNPTRDRETTGWIPGLVQWVKDLVLPQAAV